MIAVPLDWTILGDVIPARQRWGLRAVLATNGTAPGPPSLREAWVATDPIAPGGLGSSARPGRIVSDAALLPGDGAVLAIGVTTPADQPVLDLRVWRLDGGGLPRRLDAPPVPGDGPVLDPLLLPPAVEGRAATTWPPGAYRLDLLLPDRVARYTVLVPGVADRGPAQPGEPVPSLSTATVGDVMRGRPTGSFALARDGRYEAIGGRAGEALDEHAAWLDLGVRLSGGPGPSVDRVTTDRPTILGVRLPAGATRAHAELVRLAPQAGPVGTVPWSGAASRVAPLEPLGSDGLLGRPPGVDAPREVAPWFAFRAPAGGSWPGGVYRIDARWVDADGAPASGSWHLDVDGPPETREPARLLAAVRAWTWVRGRWGIVAGTGNPLADDPRDTWIRHTVTEPQTGGRDPAALGPECHGGALIVASAGVVGITHPADAMPDAVEVRRLFDGGRSLGVPVAVRQGVLPGLTLVAPRFARAWDPGHYRVELSDGDAPPTLSFCAGSMAGARLQVPPSTTGVEAWEQALRAELAGSRGGGLVVGRAPAVDGRAPAPERCGPDQRSWRRHDPSRDIARLWQDLEGRAGGWGVAAGGTHVCRDEPHTWTAWQALPDGGAPTDPSGCETTVRMPAGASVLAVTAPRGVDAAWTVVGWLTDVDGRTVLAPPIRRLRTEDRAVTAFVFADGSIWADGVYRLRIPARGRLAEHVDVCLGAG